MGRPTKKAEEKRTEFIKMYLTPQEKRKLEKIAEDQFGGITIPLGQLVRKILTEKGWL